MALAGRQRVTRPGGAVEGAQVATKALALMGAELILHADLLRRTKEAHAEAMDRAPYRSSIPDGQEIPLPNRDPR